MNLAWFVVCVPKDQPDGPGDVFGPFVDRDQAAADIAQAGGDLSCENAHVVVRGEGSEDVHSSNSAAWIAAYAFFHEHPDRIPAGCVHLFPSLFEAAV